jgi:nucleotide-binding universal stress UspA family protein
MAPNAATARVLVPLDGSELAEAILPLLGSSEHPWGSEVLLVRSLTPESPARPTAEGEAGAYLAAQAQMLERAGLRVRCEVWHGDPSQMIVNAAVRGRVDLIAMTTHGWRGLDRLRFGSVAESVVRRARVPVLLVRGRLRWPADRPPRILVPLDGSEQSAAILALVAPLRQRLHAGVELLHVVEALPPAAYPEIPLSLPDTGPGRAAARDYLGRVAARLAANGPEVECTVLEGPAAPTIVRRTSDSGADLVAMTTHGRSGVARLLVGSVAEQVLRAAEVPILLWKAAIPPAAARPGRSAEEAPHDH